MKRLLAVCALTLAVIGARLIPAPEPAQASLCASFPVSLICGVAQGAWDGVKWSVNTTTGTIRIGNRIAGTVVKKAGSLACNWIAEGWQKKLICNSITSILAKKTAQASGSPGPAQTGTTTASGDAPDSPQKYLAIHSIAAGAAAMTATVADQAVKTTPPNLGSSWFQSLYGRAVQVAGGLMLMMLMIGTLQGVIRGDGSIVIMSLRAVPAAALITAGATAIVLGALAASDSAAAAIAGSQLHQAARAMKGLAALFLVLGVASMKAASSGHSTIASVTGFWAWVYALLGAAGAGAVAFELLLRNIAIYASVLFLPLLMATWLWPETRSVPKRFAYTLAAVILAKPVLVLMLALAAGAILHGGLSGIVTGVGVLIMIAIAPFTFYRLFILAEHHFHGRQFGVQTAMVSSVSQLRQQMAWRGEQIARGPQPAYATTPPPAPSAPPIPRPQPPMTPQAPSGSSE